MLVALALRQKYEDQKFKVILTPIYSSRLPGAEAIDVCSLGRQEVQEENSLSTITVLLLESVRMVLFELYMTISYSLKFTKMLYCTIQMT